MLCLTGSSAIRFGGFLANCHRRGKLALIRQLLHQPVTELLPLPKIAPIYWRFSTDRPKHQCPFCLVGPDALRRDSAADSLAG